MKKTRIIPNKVFHDLYSKTQEYEIKDLYIKAMLNDKCFPYKRLGLLYDEAAMALKEIYRISKEITINDILSQTKLKKCDISHTFCIPIRTVEDWCTEKRNPPEYIKLMMVRYYKLCNFGKSIHVEYEMRGIPNQKKKPQNKQKRAAKELKLYDYDQIYNEIRQKDSVRRILEETQYLRERANKHL